MLAHLDRRHVRAEEEDVLDLVRRPPVRARPGKHRRGELGDGVPAEQPLAMTRGPDGIGPEEGDEVVDELLALYAFDRGDQLVDRRELGLLVARQVGGCVVGDGHDRSI